MKKRNRKIWSIKNELLIKSREAMLSAVQVFNNPNILFKSEIFIVLSNISWTYLLHSFYRKIDIDYRYFEQKPKRKEFDKTKKGAIKHWELERCLSDNNCPIDSITKSNLLFLIGLRHEIEHQMTTRIDEFLSAKFQANCLNYNHYIKKLFGEKYGIDKHLSISLQFSNISDEHAKQLNDFSDLPSNIGSYINDFDNSLSEEEFNNPQYSYRVLYVPKTANRKGQADKVIEFIPSNSPEAQGLNKEYVLIKDREKPKYLPNQIIEIMKSKGYSNFSMYQHTKIWKELKAKDENKGYGVLVANAWYWYENWIEVVENYCKKELKSKAKSKR